MKDPQERQRLQQLDPSDLTVDATLWDEESWNERERDYCCRVLQDLFRQDTAEQGSASADQAMQAWLDFFNGRSLRPTEEEDSQLPERVRIAARELVRAIDYDRLVEWMDWGAIVAEGEAESIRDGLPSHGDRIRSAESLKQRQLS